MVISDDGDDKYPEEKMKINSAIENGTVAAAAVFSVGLYSMLLKTIRRLLLIQQRLISGDKLFKSCQM